MWTLRRYLDDSRTWETAVAAVVPLFIGYELGLLLLTSGEVRNAADVHLKSLLGLDGRTGIVIVNAAILALFAFAVLGQRKKPALQLVPLVALEGAVYALLLSPVILLVRDLVTLSAGAVGSSTLDDLVLSVGAGLYEEIVFRLVCVAGGYVVLQRGVGMDPVWAAVTALIGSSLLFSAYHHVGELGEPWSAPVFVFRFLAGVILGLLYLFRGFGVVCWTHALYDVYVSLR